MGTPIMCYISDVKKRLKLLAMVLDQYLTCQIFMCDGHIAQWVHLYS